MGTASEIDEMIKIIDARKGFNYENEGENLIAKAILVAAKSQRESANEIICAIDELKIALFRVGG